MMVLHQHQQQQQHQPNSHVFLGSLPSVSYDDEQQQEHEHVVENTTHNNDSVFCRVEMHEQPRRRHVATPASSHATNIRASEKQQHRHQRDEMNSFFSPVCDNNNNNKENARCSNDINHKPSFVDNISAKRMPYLQEENIHDRGAEKECQNDRSTCDDTLGMNPSAPIATCHQQQVRADEDSCHETTPNLDRSDHQDTKPTLRLPRGMEGMTCDLFAIDNISQYDKDLHVVAVSDHDDETAEDMGSVPESLLLERELYRQTTNYRSRILTSKEHADKSETEATSFASTPVVYITLPTSRNLSSFPGSGEEQFLFEDCDCDDMSDLTDRLDDLSVEQPSDSGYWVDHDAFDDDEDNDFEEEQEPFDTEKDGVFTTAETFYSGVQTMMRQPSLRHHSGGLSIRTCQLGGEQGSTCSIVRGTYTLDWNAASPTADRMLRRSASSSLQAFLAKTISRAVPTTIFDFCVYTAVAILCALFNSTSNS